jgi:hypothetical protein
MKKIFFKCIECKNEFLRYKVKNRPQIFCSRKCYLHSKLHSERVSKQLTGMKGERNRGWKGDNVSYKGLHRWITLNYGSAKQYPCAHCNGKRGKSRMNWANLDGKYSRDISTWAPLCKLCHGDYDKKNWGSMTKLWKKK